MSVTVELISAPWCRRCHTVKPEVSAHCALYGIPLTIVEFEDLDDEDKKTIVSLPTIRCRTSAEWVSYTANQLEEWKQATASFPITVDNDF